MPSDSRQAIEEVLRIVSDGDLDQGLSLCQSRLEAAPDDVNLTALLGAILLKAGRAEDAEQHLKRAIELEPNSRNPMKTWAPCILLVAMRIVRPAFSSKPSQSVDPGPRT